MAWIMFLPGFAASFLVIAGMLRSGRVGAMDMPNERSLHDRAVPRSGGLGVLTGAAVALVVHRDSLWLLAMMLACLAALSWLDDRHSLPARVRFAVHLVAASCLVGVEGLYTPHVLLLPLMVLGVVWLTNLYNFMDGANGLAGGMALIGFGAFGLAALSAGNIPMAALAFAVSGAAGGFLVFNFHPARIFMGDVGSIPLGFLAGSMGLLGVRDGLWPLPFMLLVFSPFIVDASLTLMRRALRGEKVWQAHREHYYQRLVQSGWSHRQVAVAYYLVMLSAALCALLLQGQSASVWVGGSILWALIYLAIANIIDRHWQRHLQTRIS